jgi:hypothetical protein
LKRAYLSILSFKKEIELRLKKNIITREQKEKMNQIMSTIFLKLTGNIIRFRVSIKYFYKISERQEDEV